MANYQDDSTRNVDSKVYRWNGTIFVEAQSIPTNGARDWESFVVDGDTYLGVASHHNDATYNIDSRIYKWNGTSFVGIVAIPTNGAYDWQSFTIDGKTYLAVANLHNDSTTCIDSIIYEVSDVCLDNGLVAYYPFNGDADDESGYGNHGTVNGATLTEDRFGNCNSAYSFDGINDYIVVSDNDLLELPKISTLCLWFKIPTGGLYPNVFVSKYQSDTPSEDGYRVLIDGEGKLGISVKEGLGRDLEHYREPFVDFGEWTFFCFVVDDDQRINCYYNGTKVWTSDYILQPSGGNSRDLLFGASHYFDGTISPYTHLQGALDDVRIYRRALNESEIQALFNAGDPVNLDDGLVAYYPFNGNSNDASGNGNDGAEHGGISLTEDRFGNADSAYDFDGVDDYISVNTDLQIQNKNIFTTIANVKVEIPPTSPSENNIVMQILGNQIGGNSNNACIVVSSDGVFISWYAEGENGNLQCPNCQGLNYLPLDMNQWIQIAGVWDLDGETVTARLYVNGELKRSGVSGPITFNPTNAFPIIGRSSWGATLENGHFEGAIDDIRIYNRPLTPAEIKTLYYQQDSDGDGVSECDDNCPTISNQDQRDLDGDDIGDLCDGDVDGDGLTNDQDPDDDNDGMPDDWENTYEGLDPYFDDADDDLDGDTFSNIDEYNAGTDPNDPSSKPNLPPIIDSFIASLSDKWVVVPVDDQITFTCIAHDPDGIINGYTIDYDDGSTPETNSSGNFTYTYSTEGNYSASCAVVDNGGDSVVSQLIMITVIARWAWTKLDGPWDAQYDGAFGAFASAPNNPDIVYIGSNTLDPGVYKTTDGGLTWQEKNNGIEKIGLFTKRYPPIYQIAVSDSNPNIVYLGTAVSPDTGAIYRSSNGGDTWAKASGETTWLIPQINNAVLSIAVDPVNPDTVYVGVGNQGVFKTNDGGFSWEKIYGGTAPLGAVNCYNIVRVNHNEPSQIYVSGFTYYRVSVLPVFLRPTSSTGPTSIPGATGVLPMGIHRSADAGQNWDIVSSPEIAMVFVTDLKIESSTNDIFISTMAYQTPIFFLDDNHGIYRSKDAGSTWESVNNACAVDLSDYPIFSLVTDSDPKRLLSSSARSAFVSADDGDNWTSLPGFSSEFIGNIGIAGRKLFALTSSGIYVLPLPATPISVLDSDCDGLPDDVEITMCTSENDIDTDKDGILDGVEDINHNGAFDPGETNPCDADTDDDGLFDGNAGSEDLNNNGIVEIGETGPVSVDTDGDGILDGTERGLTDPETSDTDVSAGFFVPDSDPCSTTDPASPDTDADGVSDGNEDLNRDGAFDPAQGETDPNSVEADLNGDGDVDGSDLARLATDLGQIDLSVFAGNFGRTDCP